MTKNAIRLLAVAGAVSLAASSADAAMTFDVTGTLYSSPSGAGGSVGTLTGKFTTNDARSMVIGYNLVASAGGAFTGFTYTGSNSTVTASSLPSQYFRIDSTDLANELQLYFTAGLTSTGGSFTGTQSYEHEPSGGNRYLVGTVTQSIAMSPGAVPEPAAWAMMILGMGAIGFMIRRRNVTTRVSYAA